MDSCFPPLASLSLREHRKSTGGAGGLAVPRSRAQSSHSPSGSSSIFSSSSSGDETDGQNYGKIEILQDLEVYYIKQIAHNYKEYDLEQKIDLEIKMREGTTKLLAACKHQTQSLEAAKNLLTSNERMSAYMAELQQRRKKDAAVEDGVRANGHPNNPTKMPSYQASTARVSLSDLRMPLIWRDTDHFKNKGDYRRFAVFCLARIGTEIFNTALLCPVDRSLTDLTFPDVLVFNHVPADFEFKLEIYSHILQDDLSMASAPRKIKKTIHSSISRTVGKKLAASLKDELQTGKIGPNFELMASAHLSLAEVHDSIHTHDLNLESIGNRTHQLPLFGHFCCRLAAQPDCISREVFSGPLQLLLTAEDQEREGLGRDEKAKKGSEDTAGGGRGHWCGVWGQLQAFHLDLWEKREDFDQGRDPIKSITVDKETSIRGGSSSSREISLGNMCEGKEDISFVRTTSCEDQQKWIRYFVQHAKDHQRWKQAAEKIMEIQSPGSTKNSFLREIRQRSLYDETPLIESLQSDYRNGHRPTVQEIFGLTPSTSLSSCASSSSSPPMPPFRERSLSIGTNGNISKVSKGTFGKTQSSVAMANSHAPLSSSSASSSSSSNSCNSSATPMRWPFGGRHGRK
ncbi:rhotekin-like isoform X2 [Ischnura elegans]|uniref:rhotekin-like isoform X2 n=1 Tax=Ischnura elegans TaxID=197161 RepID=UPI001ED8A496|nr:rhotekin-like isoform X2 [Ischnura elegans]